LPPFFRKQKEARRLNRFKEGEKEAKENLDAGPIKSGDEPGKTPENLAELSAKGG